MCNVSSLHGIITDSGSASIFKSISFHYKIDPTFYKRFQHLYQYTTELLVMSQMLRKANIISVLPLAASSSFSFWKSNNTYRDKRKCHKQPPCISFFKPVLNAIFHLITLEQTRRNVWLSFSDNWQPCKTFPKFHTMHRPWLQLQPLIPVNRDLYQKGTCFLS